MCFILLDKSNKKESRKQQNHVNGATSLLLQKITLSNPFFLFLYLHDCTTGIILEASSILVFVVSGEGGGGGRGEEKEEGVPVVESAIYCFLNSRYS